MNLRVLILLAAAALTCESNTATAQDALTQADHDEIRALGSAYLRSLGACDAEAYADLFAPGFGYFASGFRGQMIGRRQLMALVDSERHCRAGSSVQRAAGSARSTVEIAISDEGVFGLTDLGTARYYDEYVQTSAGWRFASRWVLIAPEIDFGLTAADMQAISALSGPGLGEHFVPDDNGELRLLNAGVTIAVEDSRVTGRVFMDDGSYYDDVYERLGPERWRIGARVHVPNDDQ